MGRGCGGDCEVAVNEPTLRQRSRTRRSSTSGCGEWAGVAVDKLTLRQMSRRCGEAGEVAVDCGRLRWRSSGYGDFPGSAATLVESFHEDRDDVVRVPRAGAAGPHRGEDGGAAERGGVGGARAVRGGAASRG